MRRTLGNLASVIGGEALLRLVNFTAAVVVARSYGASALGLYATALAFATVATMLAINGLHISAVAEIHRQRDRINPVVITLHTAMTLLVLPMVLCLLGFGFLIELSREAWLVSALVTCRTVVQGYCQLEFGILKAIDRMAPIGVIQTIHSVILFVGVAVVYWYSLPFVMLLGCLVCGQFVELVLSLREVAGAGIRPERVPFRECWLMLRRSVPIGFTYFMANLMVRLDVIVLSALTSAPMVGQFSAAQTVIVMVYLAGWLFGSVLLPELSKLSLSAKPVKPYVSRWSFLLLAATVPATVLGFWLSPFFVRVVFGAEFAEAGSLLSIMIIAIPFILLNSLLLSTAIALGLTSTYTGTYLATGILTLALQLVLGSLFGAMGIAVVTVAREICMFLVFRHQIAPRASQAAIVTRSEGVAF